MTDMRPRLGLRARLIIVNSVVVLVLGFFIVMLISKAYTDHWLIELRKSWVILAGHFSEDVIDPILTGDDLRLRAEVVEHTEDLPEEVYIVVVDEHNNVLAHSFDEGLPSDLRALSGETLGRHSTTEVVLNGERLFDVGIPVLEGSVGTIHIGFAEEGLHREMDRFMGQVAGAALVALVLQMLISIAVVARITRPILDLGSLAEQVRRIGRGMMTVPVQVGGTNEVAEVASAYNTMREEILGYERQLRSLASELSLSEERQRRRIASQIHDYIGQVMVALNIKLGTLSKKVGDPGIAEEVAEMRKLVDDVVRDTRTLIFEIACPVLNELGLVPALEWLCGQAEERYGRAVRFAGHGVKVNVDDDLRALLFQAAQELLLNVVKHAEAKEVTLSVAVADGKITIEVEDDGKGFDAGRVLSRGGEMAGFGLFSIRERLQFFQGDLTVESAPGHGATATITVPLS